MKSRILESLVSSAIGGENIGETVEGLQRFPISLPNQRLPTQALANNACPTQALSTHPKLPTTRKWVLDLKLVGKFTLEKKHAKIR